MPRDGAAASAAGARRLARIVIGAWVMVLAVVCLRTLWQPRVHSTYPIFITAARNWLAGQDIYYKGNAPPGGLDDFRYSPLAAPLLTPLAFLSDNIGGVLWRLLNAAALVGGLFWCGRSVFQELLTPRQRLLFFLLVLPLAAGNFNNGQSNPLVLGLVLASVAAAAECRWNIAAVCIALASLLKIYPIGIALLLVVLYPRQFFSRLTVALCGGLIVPFLLQHPDYVRTQYAEWLVCLMGDDRHVRPIAGCYRDFQLLCRLYVVPLNPLVYRVIEITAGAAAAALCVVGHRAQWPQARLLNFTLGLGCCWMTVFGPATESATYLLLAPALASSVIESWTSARASRRGFPLLSSTFSRAPLASAECERLRNALARGSRPNGGSLLTRALTGVHSVPWLCWLLVADYGLFVIAQVEGCLAGPGLLRPYGLQPLAGLLFAGLLLMFHFTKNKEVPVDMQSSPAKWLKAA